MKVFRVTTERDGETTKAPGKVSTEIVREEYLYAAEDIQRVWVEVEYLRNSMGHELISVSEVAPAITVLPPNA